MSWDSQRGKRGSCGDNAICLKKQPPTPKTTQKSSVLAGAIGVLEGRKGDDDLCWGHVGVVQSALLGALHVCTSRASRQS